MDHLDRLVIFQQGPGYAVIDLQTLTDKLTDDQASYLTDKLLERLKTDIRKRTDELTSLANESPSH